MAATTKTANISLLKQAKKDRAEGSVPSRLLVLVGIPGSGKSTFAARLASLNFQVVCQDNLGDRRRCEMKTVEHLLAEDNIVIDRCNFDVSQRKHWVDYGKASGAEIGVIVFGVALENCVDRVRNRFGHPTLDPGGAADHVVYRMARDFVFPTPEEGFSFCRILRTDEDANRIFSELHRWAAHT